MNRPSAPPRPMPDPVRVTPGNELPGHALDAVLRKGVRVTKAIETAAMMDD